MVYGRIEDANNLQVSVSLGKSKLTTIRMSSTSSPLAATSAIMYWLIVQPRMFSKIYAEMETKGNDEEMHQINLLTSCHQECSLTRLEFF